MRTLLSPDLTFLKHIYSKTMTHCHTAYSRVNTPLLHERTLLTCTSFRIICSYITRHSYSVHCRECVFHLHISGHIICRAGLSCFIQQRSPVVDLRRPPFRTKSNRNVRQHSENDYASNYTEHAVTDESKEINFSKELPHTRRIGWLTEQITRTTTVARLHQHDIRRVIPTLYTLGMRGRHELHSSERP